MAQTFRKLPIFLLGVIVGIAIMVIVMLYIFLVIIPSFFWKCISWVVYG